MNPQSPRSPYLDRRRVLTLLTAGVGTAIIAGCSSDQGATTSSTTTGNSASGAPDSTTSVIDTSTPPTSTTEIECSPIPDETAGPFPGDGSNGPDVLSIDGVERSDIRTSIGDATGTATGTKLTIDLTVVDSSSSCFPLAGAAVYLWHADSVGRYSMYSSGADTENYLRGVQVADDSGKLSFVSVFPGCYDGRWPHIHFEVYASRADVGSVRPLVTSQLAFPRSTCEQAYAAAGYEKSVGNLDRVTLESDMVFRDGVDDQLATMTGDSANGFTASLTIAV